jgi:uncharacterized protein YprB with RNaseH-like and TPR domain
VFDIETTGGLKAHMSEVEAFGYKWLGEPGVEVLSCLDTEQKFYNDRPLLKELTKVWNQADAVVAHYGEKFDRRFLNTRIEHYRLPPLKPLPLIDTWRLSKDNFALPGNSLRVLLTFFGAPHQKLDLTYSEWRRVMLGHIPSLRKLNEHCKADVLGLEWVFKTHLIHYTRKLPSLATDGSLVCPQCGGGEMFDARGFVYKPTKRWVRYYCWGCKRWAEGPKGGKVRF